MLDAGRGKETASPSRQVSLTSYRSLVDKSDVARATSVLKYFIEGHDMDPSRFSVRGNADQKRIAPNDTAENRVRNRRVEIKLKKTETSEYGL